MAQSPEVCKVGDRPDFTCMQNMIANFQIETNLPYRPSFETHNYLFDQKVNKEVAEILTTNLTDYISKAAEECNGGDMRLCSIEVLSVGTVDDSCENPENHIYAVNPPLVKCKVRIIWFTKEGKKEFHKDMIEKIKEISERHSNKPSGVSNYLLLPNTDNRCEGAIVSKNEETVQIETRIKISEMKLLETVDFNTLVSWTDSLKILVLFFLSFVYQFYAVHKLKEDGRNVVEHLNAACNSTNYYYESKNLTLKLEETHQLKSYYEGVNQTCAINLANVQLTCNHTQFNRSITLLNEAEKSITGNYSNLVNSCRSAHLQKSLTGYYFILRILFIIVNLCTYWKSILKNRVFMIKWMETWKDEKSFTADKSRQFKKRFQNKYVKLLAIFIFVLSTNEILVFIFRVFYSVVITQETTLMCSLTNALPFSGTADHFWLEIFYQTLNSIAAVFTHRLI